MTLPIAETFHSIQGEGHHTGVPMHFVRTAGCNVGRTPVVDGVYHTCQVFTGKPFLCDTNYTAARKVDTYNLVSATYEDWICLTGGEPLIQPVEKLREFLTEAYLADKSVHLETSGTINLAELHHAMNPIGEISIRDEVWFTYIACSPKQGFIPDNIRWVDELKFLIGEEADCVNIERFYREHIDGRRLNDIPRLYIQPINHTNTINKESFDLCMRFLRSNPHFRLSVQLHKLVGLQ